VFYQGFLCIPLRQYLPAAILIVSRRLHGMVALGWLDWSLVLEKLKLVAVCLYSGLIGMVLKLSPTPLIVVSRR
jgi:hypothetical protein